VHGLLASPAEAQGNEEHDHECQVRLQHPGGINTPQASMRNMRDKYGKQHVHILLDGASMGHGEMAWHNAADKWGH